MDAWETDAWAASIAVIIGDSWQWIPFMFIVLLAALEAQDHEVFEAAYVMARAEGRRSGT